MNAKELNAEARKAAETIKTEPLGSLSYMKSATTVFEATGNPVEDFQSFYTMIHKNVVQLRAMDTMVANQGRETSQIESQELPSELAAIAAKKGAE